jgi:flagellar hook-basal body complex protein FliE
MNTAVLNALRQVRDAKTNVLTRLSDHSLSQDEKKVLGEILLNLQEQENTLINLTLQDMIDKINASNADLQTLIQQMDQTSTKLSDISDTIKKVSGVLSTLTDIINKALGAGLL